jgi:hypothetical protein
MMKRRHKDRADSIEVISPKAGSAAHPTPVPLDPLGQSFTVVVQVDPANGHSLDQVWAVAYNGNPPPTAIGEQPLDEVGGAGSGSDCYYGTLTAACDTPFGIYATAEMTDDTTGAPVDPPPSTNTGVVYTGVCDRIVGIQKKRKIGKYQRPTATHKKTAKKAAKKQAVKKNAGKKKMAKAARKKSRKK